MRNITRRGVGARFQLAAAIGAPTIPYVNSTLNEAINNTNVVPFQPTIPTAGMEFADDYNFQLDSGNIRIQYLAIGRGGHKFTQNATNSAPKIGTKPHSARSTGFFDLMPFVAKPLDADLSPTDRAKYRLRKVIEINGVLYAAYFLRHIDLSTSTINQEIVRVQAGVKTSTPYEPTIDDLNPSDPVITGVNDGSYLYTSITLDVTFNEQEAAWYREVCDLWFNDPDLADISEIALCSGVDKVITTRFPATGSQTAQAINSSIKEAVAVQVTISESTFISLTFSNGGVSERITVGMEDPLYGAAYNTTTSP